MLNKYGDFSNGGKEFIITTPNIERNWYNYLYNDNYITFTSQAGIGQGFLQDRLGNRIMPVEERGVYAVSDDGDGWNLAGLPVYSESDFYRCVHGLGYTTIELQKNDIFTEYTLFVPNEDSRNDGYEVILVHVQNKSRKNKSVKIMAYAGNSYDSRYQYQGYNVRSVAFAPQINGICYGLDSGDWNGEKKHFEGFITCGQTVSGYDCAKNAFIGPYGSFSDPSALHHGGCTNSDCIAEKFGFALQSTLELAPGEDGFVSFITGVAENCDRINQITERFSDPDKCRNELTAATKKFNDILGDMKITTPDPALDCLFNSWLKYQTNMGSRWARVRHNGYRDIVSDTECLATFNAPLAWKRIRRMLAYQYSNGYAPRTFEDGAIRDNNFSDCTVWLTFAVHYIINELGDPSLLLEECPYNDGTSSTVYEHLRRSVDFLYNFRGLHDLIQIWGGDWNDCMDHAGRNHRGVSVWLTMAWYRADRQFAELARMLGKGDDSDLAESRAEEIKALVDRYGWDEVGGYYIYAYNDDDRKIGAHDNAEGSIYLNPQIWAILSGIAVDGKEITAMKNAERMLTYELGTAVLTPAYTFYDRGIGTMTYKSPGVQENGGVYLHPMCWKLASDSILGDEEAVRRDIESILPFRNPVVAGRAEPYVLCNSYMGRETGYRYGTPGQSWRTATGQWFLHAMVNYVFGITPTLDGLRLKPCLPSDWNKAEITKPFRRGIYHITYIRTGKKKLTVNGETYANDTIPSFNGHVEVIMEF